ncbi:MAG: hypothetical protein ACI9MC_000606 [Kiritimatiellia bacterium]|jgi:hypothetical protein
MRRSLLLFLALACTSDPGPTDDSDDSDEPTCEPGEARSYDTAESPELYSEDDPIVGFSPQDVADTMLGSFAGTYTPDNEAAFQVDVAIGIDGVVVVQDFVGEGCASVWSAPLVLAMSSEKVNDVYLIDDLWGPKLQLEGLDAGAFTGVKPAEDFDGTIDATGEVHIDATFASGGWTGSMAFGDMQHGTFEVVRE